MLLPSQTLLADTIGDALINRSLNDTSSGSIFLINTPFSIDGIVTDWSFFDDDSTTLQLTPLIFKPNGSLYQLSGIGQTITTNGTGIQNTAFNLVQGSAVIQPGDFFGWKDGSNGTSNTGVIDWDNSNSASTDGVTWLGDNRTSFNIGDDNTASGNFFRQYSVQATATVPEPGTIALLVCAMPLLLRRRRDHTT